MKLPVGKPRLRERRLAEAWDRDASLRHFELTTRHDNAYYILIERIALLYEHQVTIGARILDVGCGLGVLAFYLAEQHHTVTGIDISRVSIAQAQSDFGASATFRVANVVRLPGDLLRCFDVVVASMIWHNHPNLNALVAGCRAALKNGGFIIATVAEPKSYLIKQGVRHKYDTPRRFEFPLRHAYCCGTHTPVPYYHRPIDLYLETLRRNRFVDIDIASDALMGESSRNDVVTFVGSAAAGYDTPRERSKQSDQRRQAVRQSSRIVPRGSTEGAPA